MKLLPWSVSISLGIPTLENKLIKALENFVGSLPMTDSKNRFILVCVDVSVFC
jgi:hypothetical protein